MLTTRLNSFPFALCFVDQQLQITIYSKGQLF